MHSHTRYSFIRAIAAPTMAALVLVIAIPSAHAEVTRTGTEPWYQQSTADARKRAQTLFARAVDKHRQLLHADAVALYEQALTQWDNPDIRWNLALVLEDLGQYLRAYQQLDRALRWREALGAERLRDVQARMQALETQPLAQIEAFSPEPGADIELDGQPWFRGAARRSTPARPGTHSITSTKPGYFPVTQSVYVTAGEEAHVALPMDEDRLIETQRWPAWKPWAVVVTGVAVAAVGSGLEVQALALRNAAGDTLKNRCHTLTCEPAPPPSVYHQAVTKQTFATSAFAVGGAAIAVGLALAWLNQPRQHRTEARAPSRIEFTPILSPHQAEVSALVRF